MPERNISLYLNDILDATEAIQNYTNNLSYENFAEDRRTYSATLREFEIIGEAVSKLPDTIKMRYPRVEWRDIKDFRNLLIHEYFGVDLEMVWRIVKEDLPLLIDTVQIMLEEINEK